MQDGGGEIMLIEVGPRDGLQNAPEAVPTATKLALIDRLIAAGLRRFEVTSFVHPKKVPQMADAEALVAQLPDRPDVSWIGLVLNERGLDRALATRAGGRGIDEAGLVIVASDSFSRRNQGMSMAESVRAACRIIARARAEGLKTTAMISAAFGCPFEGRVPPQRVLALAEELAAAGPDELALADTIGVAVPAEVEELFAAARERVPAIPWRAHFHDTRNTGTANVWAAVRAGVRRVDASIGGLGGCPFAPAATGNVATEDVAYLLARSGLEAGLDISALIETTHWLEGELGRPLPAALARAGLPTGRPAETVTDGQGAA